MKGSLAGALAGFQGLGSDDSRERPVDRLAAMGVIGRRIGRESHALQLAHLCSLGVDLIAFKFGNRASSGKDAEDKLSIILAWPCWKLKVRAGQRDRIARHAVAEWAIDICPACQGAGEVPFRAEQEIEGTQPMKACPACSGSGKRRYSDQERTEAMGDPFSRAMFEAHGIIGRAERLAVEQAKAMLERW